MKQEILSVVVCAACFTFLFSLTPLWDWEYGKLLNAVPCFFIGANGDKCQKLLRYIFRLK